MAMDIDPEEVMEAVAVLVHRTEVSPAKVAGAMNSGRSRRAEWVSPEAVAEVMHALSKDGRLDLASDFGFGDARSSATSTHYTLPRPAR